MSNQVGSSRARRTVRRARTALGLALIATVLGWLGAGLTANAQVARILPNSQTSPPQDNTTLRVLEPLAKAGEPASTEVWIDSDSVSQTPTAKLEANTRSRFAPGQPSTPAQPARINTPAQLATPAGAANPNASPASTIAANKPAVILEVKSPTPQQPKKESAPTSPVVTATAAAALRGEFVPASSLPQKPSAPSVAQSPAAAAVVSSPKPAGVSEPYPDLVARLNVASTFNASASTAPGATAGLSSSVFGDGVLGTAGQASSGTRPPRIAKADAPPLAAQVAAASVPETAKTAVRIEPTVPGASSPFGTPAGQRSLVDLAADLQAIQPDDVPFLARVPSDSSWPTPAPPRPQMTASVQKGAAVPAPPAPAAETAEAPLTPTPMVDPGRQLGPFEVIDSSEEMKVIAHRSKLLRTKVDIFRTAVVDPGVCEIVQFTPREISIIGKREGATDVTFWFSDETHRPLTCLVRVIADPDLQQRREEQYSVLQDYLAELFPNSKVTLTPVADKLLVRGQARDAAEAAQILSIIRGQAVVGGPYVGYYGNGAAAPPLPQDANATAMPATQVINMLRIPGVQQVSLRVKIGELNRSAARNFGVEMNMSFADGKLVLKSMVDAFLQSTPTILGSFDNHDLEFGIHYLEKHGVVRMLSEPTLTTLSGHPATFIAGGEFAVPTTVGVQGVSAVTTDFRAFGAIITFLPTILDKDNVRLEVAPEFSKINNDLAVNGTPGLNTRAVTTTVELRSGQTLAIAGLLDDSMSGDNQGDLPVVSQIFGKRTMTRNETELIILVTPELVHPMEPEEVPPLPGFDVTEPTNCEFFIKGELEGVPTQDYRSTVWPTLRQRYQHGGPAMISGPFGHGN